MKAKLNRFVLVLALMIGFLVGLVGGAEAKQKWVFRIKSLINEKKQQAEQKKLIRGGAVLLDEMEIEAFHKM